MDALISLVYTIIFAILLVGTQIAPSILQGLVAALTADAITLSISRCQN